MAHTCKPRPDSSSHLAFHHAIAATRKSIAGVLFLLLCVAMGLAQENASPTARVRMEGYAGNTGMIYYPSILWRAPRSTIGEFKGIGFMTNTSHGLLMDSGTVYTPPRLSLVSARVEAGRTPRGSFVQIGPQVNLESLPGVSKVMRMASVSWLSRVQGGRNPNVLILAASKPIALGKDFRTHLEVVYDRDYVRSATFAEYRAFLQLPGNKRIQPAVIVRQDHGLVLGFGARISIK